MKRLSCVKVLIIGISIINIFFFSFTDKVYIYIKNIVLKIIFHFYIIEIRRIYSEKIKYLIKYFIKINNYLSQNISL